MPGQPAVEPVGAGRVVAALEVDVGHRVAAGEAGRVELQGPGGDTGGPRRGRPRPGPASRGSRAAVGCSPTTASVRSARARAACAGVGVGRHQGEEDDQLEPEQVSREPVVVTLPGRPRRPHALAGQGHRRLDERPLPVVRLGPATGGSDLGLDVERLPREPRQQRRGRPRDGQPGVGGDHRAQRVGGARAAGAVPVQEHLPERCGVGVRGQGHSGRHRRFNASHPARSWTAIPAYDGGAGLGGVDRRERGGELGLGGAPERLLAGDRVGAQVVRLDREPDRLAGPGTRVEGGGTGRGDAVRPGGSGAVAHHGDRVDPGQHRLVEPPLGDGDLVEPERDVGLHPQRGGRLQPVEQVEVAPQQRGLAGTTPRGMQPRLDVEVDPVEEPGAQRRGLPAQRGGHVVDPRRLAAQRVHPDPGGARSGCAASGTR